MISKNLLDPWKPIYYFCSWKFCQEILCLFVCFNFNFFNTKNILYWGMVKKLKRDSFFCVVGSQGFF